jgi:hypothetical protein
MSNDAAPPSESMELVVGVTRGAGPGEFHFQASVPTDEAIAHASRLLAELYAQKAIEKMQAMMRLAASAPPPPVITTNPGGVSAELLAALRRRGF